MMHTEAEHLAIIAAAESGRPVLLRVVDADSFQLHYADEGKEEIKAGTRQIAVAISAPLPVATVISRKRSWWRWWLPVFVFAVLLAGCDGYQDYEIHEVVLSDAELEAWALDYGTAVDGLVRRVEPHAYTARLLGDGWTPAWPMGRECTFFAEGAFECYTPYRTVTGEMVINCWTITDGVFDVDGFCALSWMTCACTGERCSTLLLFVIEPAWLEGIKV